mgnify:CR=1 FL=1|jgi:hypothetical protein
MSEPNPTYCTGQTFGRPRLSGAPMQPVTVRLTAEQIAYLDKLGGTTEGIRFLINLSINKSPLA